MYARKTVYLIHYLVYLLLLTFAAAENSKFILVTQSNIARKQFNYMHSLVDASIKCSCPKQIVYVTPVRIDHLTTEIILL